MKRLRKFLLLSSGDRWLLVNAALLLWVIKLGLVLLPFRTVRWSISKMAKLSLRSVENKRCSVEDIVRAVERAGNFTPWARTCLTQALTAQVLLLRRNHPAWLHIGVVKGERGELLAHAWVKSEDEVVIGGFELERYTPLAALGIDSESPA